MKSASEFVFPEMWLHATASGVRLRRAAYMCTMCCPFSERDETL